MPSIGGGLEEGEALTESKQEKRTCPIVDADMRAAEIMAFVVESPAVQRFRQATPRDFRPADFVSLSGCRLGSSMVPSKGQELERLATAAIHDDKLNRILYWGPRLYYFPKYKEEVEVNVASIVVSA